MSRLKRIATITLASLLGGCASAPPVHYYTLVPSGLVPSGSAAGGASAGAAVAGGGVGSGPAGARFQFELLPVGIPVQVDQPQLVVRQGGQGIALLGGERWIAPLADEVRGALSADLARDLHTEDVSGMPASGEPRLRIKVDLRRFDSVPGSYALIDAAWSVRALAGTSTLTCTSHISETVGTGFDALVQGHQQALAQLAAQIARVAAPLAAGEPARCPAS